MMGKKKLSEIKAQLGLAPHGSRNKPPKAQPGLKPDPKAIADVLQKKLAALERAVSKRRKSKARQTTKG